jgi:hypothetical protein
VEDDPFLMRKFHKLRLAKSATQEDSTGVEYLPDNLYKNLSLTQDEGQ